MLKSWEIADGISRGYSISEISGSEIYCLKCLGCSPGEVPLSFLIVMSLTCR